MPSMTKFFTALPIVAAMALATPVLAQDDATTEPAATTADSDLALGQEVGNEGLGSAYNKESIGDWTLQCIRTEEETDPCQLYQLLKDKDGNDVAEISLFRLPEGGQAIAGATVIAPLGTLLTAQLTIGVDTATGKRYPFTFCNAIGCYARIGLTKEDVAAFKRGANATITLVPYDAPDVKVELGLSLKGFTAGYEVVTRFSQ